MFTNYSMAGAGAAASVVLFVLRYFGLDVDEGMVTEGMLSLMQAIAFIVWLVGQFRREDLRYGLLRK